MEVSEAVEAYLKEIDKARVEMFGGQKAVVDYQTIPGYVVIAYVEQAGPEPVLAIFKTEEFVTYVSELMAEWRV